MKPRSLCLLAGATLLAAMAPAACSSSAAADADTEVRVARGKYLVTVGGCNDCHTPLRMGPKGPEPDMTRMLSGHPSTFAVTPGPADSSDPWLMHSAPTGTAFAGPWGVSFAANLTPDGNTGTGIWTEDIFINAVRTGKHWGTSRDILPPMPWMNYREMTDEDLRAVFAYLRSIPPVHNQVPEPLTLALQGEIHHD